MYVEKPEGGVLRYFSEVLRDQEIEEEPAKDIEKEQSVKRKK